MTRRRIRAGCEPESSRVIHEKNRLLAEELHKLLNGKQGVLRFLDNCSLICGVKSRGNQPLCPRSDPIY